MADINEENKPTIETTNNSYIAQQQNSKNIFCKQCGSMIDKESKICSGCGKQYFRMSNFAKKPVVMVALLLIVIALTVICVFQQINISKQASEVQNLITETVDLKEQVSTKQSTINTLHSRINALERDVKSYKELSAFVNNYVVFIEDDGTKRYHKFECDKFVGESFWVYNIEAAKSNGYRECQLCH